LKCCVYGICKNEEKFIWRWLDSVKDGDYIALVDTGSNDRTQELIQQWVQQHDFPNLVLEKYQGEFRFDKAREQALCLAERTGAKLLLSLDIDELIQPGWRELLIPPLERGVSGLRLRLESGGSIYPALRCHTPGWHWIHACHEVVSGPGPVEDSPVLINHRPDGEKSRSDYLSLLELDAKERPQDGRAWHYLGREYYYREQWTKAIETLVRSLKYDHWNEQRCASMRFISRCCWHLGRTVEAEYWARAALKEYRSREACVDLAWLLEQLQDNEAAHWGREALAIKEDGSYPGEASALAYCRRFRERLNNGEVQ